MQPKHRAIFVTSGILVSVVFFSTLSGTTQDFLKSPVNLQAANPGFSQSGHANISGTMRAGQFIGNLNVPSGAASGKVLTSDAIGNASWQFPTFALPFSGMFAGPGNVAFSVTHSGDGRAATFGNNSATFPAILSSNGNGTSISATGHTLGIDVTGNLGNPNSKAGNFVGMLTGITSEAKSLTGVSYGVYGKSASGSGAGVFGETTSTAPGVHGRGNANGVGVRAEAVGDDADALYATVTGARGTAVLAEVSSTVTGTMYGVDSRAISNSGTGIGVRGQSNTFLGIGVQGIASNIATTTYGGHFESMASFGHGVYGLASSLTSNTTYGGYFQSNSTGGRGVYGYTPAATGFTYAVFGVADSVDGRGVYGFAGNAAGTPYGVYGRTPASNAGYGVYSNGDLGASGVKSFRIDHPFDPLNKYLLHYAAESPFPQNFYSGNVTTDSNGYAWVELPEYFNAINTNVKYQLTIVDDADSEDFVQVKVSKKVKGNRFQIRTSAPNVEVSWRIEADRDDDRIKFNRPTDVREKRDAERGKYQNPEYHGAPPEMGIDADRTNAKKG